MSKKIVKDSLGDRMKNHENRFRFYMPKKSYTMIRLDGKSFHSYTKGFKKPFDYDLMEDMQKTTLELCKNVPGCEIGYCQSDEITLVLVDFKNRDSEAWFDGNLQKMVSISSSIATSYFNQFRMKRANSFEIKLAQFDSRIWSLSDPWEVYNAFLWRQQDATKNSIQMVAQSLLSHKECQNKHGGQLQELIFQKGQNWNDYPTVAKRGTFFYKVSENVGDTIRSSWKTDIESPILTTDPNWFFEKLSLIEQPQIKEK